LQRADSDALLPGVPKNHPEIRTPQAESQSPRAQRNQSEIN
jgi:hypothetical protein